MAEGYCVKCKAKKPISDAVEEIMKNGRKAIKGRCPTCGTVMFKILGGKATVVAPPAPPVPPAEDRGASPSSQPVVVPNAPSHETPKPKTQESAEVKKPTN